MPLLVKLPVKTAGAKRTSIFFPLELITLPFTVVVPPARVMAPLLVRVPLRNIPNPLIWPVLLMTLPLLSNVPPARDIVPALMARPWVKRSLLAVEAARDPVLVEAGLVRMSVPPKASMVPVVLLMVLLMLPKPWMVAVLVMVPPASV